MIWTHLSIPLHLSAQTLHLPASSNRGWGRCSVAHLNEIHDFSRLKKKKSQDSQEGKPAAPEADGGRWEFSSWSLALTQETPSLQSTDFAPAVWPRPPALWPRWGRRPRRRWPARTWLPSAGLSVGRWPRLRPIPEAAGGGAWTRGQWETVEVLLSILQQPFYLLCEARVSDIRADQKTVKTNSVLSQCFT